MDAVKIFCDHWPCFCLIRTHCEDHSENFRTPDMYTRIDICSTVHATLCSGYVFRSIAIQSRSTPSCDILILFVRYLRLYWLFNCTSSARSAAVIRVSGTIVARLPAALACVCRYVRVQRAISWIIDVVRSIFVLIVHCENVWAISMFGTTREFKFGIFKEYYFLLIIQISHL